MQIKYFDGVKTIELEVTEKVAIAYTESRREEWRSDKRAERYQTMLSFGQMEDDGENGKVNDLIRAERSLNPAITIKDRLTEIIEAEERSEREQMLMKLRETLPLLSDEQRRIVTLVYAKNTPIKLIAEELGITYQSVQDRLKVILKKLKKVLEK